MAKTKTQYICQACGASSPKWLGKCPQCGAWNSMEETVMQTSKADKRQAAVNFDDNQTKLHQLKKVQPDSYSRIPSKIGELDRVLGGGMMPGSVVLIGGEPGIGKSTLLLQLTLQNSDKKIVYVAGEESTAQIKDRADRLGEISDNCFISTELIVENLNEQLKKEKPALIIVDSIQTLQSHNLESIPGTISQIRETAYQLINMAKYLNVPLFLVGHITKSGNIAGPKVLEHMVDTVLQFEGEHTGQLRLLRTTKNRFGSTAEIGVFEMQQNGLREVSNPSEILVQHYAEQLTGTAVAVVNEGIRPLMVEVQALVSPATYGTPQRTANGYNPKRLNMLLAVLEKRAGLKLSTRDVFVNIAGGLKIADTAIDLAMAAAIISSYLDLEISPQTCFSGEIGLAGEIRPVSRMEQRISEARRLGYKKVFTRSTNKSGSNLTDIRQLVKQLN
ncbi:DNA repair protein RadA [Salinivirga cyanobacteriivorans]|uniref:DNA repair protein RadA n=1 Tax=Salinivirga cyanobacteriivorans TaxID=1307839 RepID=A0A0S2I1T0_9BACT|nr:DNA repair protein RadA [Salinivirga cyanobacteriivorans]ALO15996.1 Lon protease 2 [Salinivirga cyanobacteriivorans]